MRSIRVVVADDDELMRDTLTALLLTDPRFEVVGEADSGAGLVEVVASTRPQVALVDVRMDGGGADAIRALEEGPPVVVVGISSEVGAHHVVEMLRAGARGFLTKGRVGAALPDLVARCAHGEVIIASPAGGEVLRQLLSVPAR